MSRNLELDLVRRAQTGDEEAFMELVTALKPGITRMASRFGSNSQETADLTQEIFLEIWKALPGFREKAPFEHWVSRVSLNRCRKFLRHEFRRRKSEIFQEDPAKFETGGSFQERKDLDAREILQFGMRRMKPDDALVLSLRELEGHSLEEVSSLTGWSVANVKVRAHRARKRLKRILQETREWP